uniref:Uncharacterized protein n=1 Tax=Romanomermis culicivorax TaxID=13658 RepID=A0A915KBQ8_ROMCU
MRHSTKIYLVRVNFTVLNALDILSIKKISIITEGRNFTGKN